MRIALVSTHYAPFVGGIETHVAQLARALHRRGESVSVLTLDRLPGVPNSKTSEVAEGVSVTRVASYGFGESLRWPARLVEPGSFDLVHFHGFSRALLLRIAFDCRQIPWVVTPHGGIRGIFTDPLIPRRLAKGSFDRTIGRRLLLRAARIIALTAIEAVHLECSLGIDRARINIIPNALASDAFDFASPAQGESNRLLIMSRLAPVKRVGDLLSALSILSNPPGCDIAGPDGGELAVLRAQSSRFRPGLIEFLGTVVGAPKRQLLRRAKALVLPSALETFSITALEAIAQGTPVIASDVAAAGLPRSAVLTFPVGDVNALARRIESLQDPDVMTPLRSGALEARGTIITDAIQGSRILQVYREAVG